MAFGKFRKKLRKKLRKIVLNLLGFLDEMRVEEHDESVS